MLRSDVLPCLGLPKGDIGVLLAGDFDTVARSIRERLPNVVNYCEHRITNAVAEGMNRKIMSIKRRVGGFRNVQNF
ncbi:transposase [Rhodopirellula sallentina]|uniref:transposase n=1 Tax=Rhodopirellula sallentina TaxID=1263869 RepID=UPI001F47276F|nr:transposase [Rhodopirellula sallentina]